MFELKLENSKGNVVNIDDGVYYAVVGISGLNPPSASIFKSTSPNRKGVKHNGLTIGERVLIISVKLLGNIELNRNRLYDWVDTGEYVKIFYRNDTKNVYCEGLVEECDVNTYSAGETMNIAISCEDPYWKDLNELAIELSNIIKQFTFPFAISEPIPFSTTADNNSTTIYNDGAETGMVITINCTAPVKNLTIYDPNDVTKQIKILTTLEENSIVKIDTDISPKTIKYYKPDGTVENILKYVDKNLTWFTLKRGSNTFGYSADSGVNNVNVTISFINKYLGV